MKHASVSSTEHGSGRRRGVAAFEPLQHERSGDVRSVATAVGFATIDSMSAADDFRKHAEECRFMAALALDADYKAFWLRLAQDWLNLAEEADVLQSKQR
jgi:hypothetical protein